MTPLPKPSIDTGAGPRAGAVGAPGRRLGLRARRDPPSHLGGRGPVLDDLRHRRAQRRVAAHRRRARPDHDVPRLRRRVPVERGPRLRAPAHHPPRHPPRLPPGRRDGRPAVHGRRRGRRRWPTTTPSSRPATPTCARWSSGRRCGSARRCAPGRSSSTDALDEVAAMEPGPARRVGRLPAPRHLRVPARGDRGGRGRAGHRRRPRRLRRGDGRRNAGAAATPARPSASTPTRRRSRRSSTTPGPTEFTGREEDSSAATVLAVLDDSIVLDRTPFYAESGGQVGDTGVIETATGRATVIDTVYGAPGLTRHVIGEITGEIVDGQEAKATIDVERRAAIRRNHTATHILHWALRHVLGDHVKQQGSLVAPDRLRFDFSHYAALTDDEIRRIEDLANAEILVELARPPLRDHQGPRRDARSHRVLRRQVRRPGARARGRATTRSSSAAAPTSARSATSARSRSSRRARSARTSAASRPSPAPARSSGCASAKRCWRPPAERSACPARRPRRGDREAHRASSSPSATRSRRSVARSRRPRPGRSLDDAVDGVVVARVDGRDP